MGSFLDKPKTDKTNAFGEGNGLKYGLASMQGWRVEMEDAHSALIGLPLTGLEDWSFFAVFDGHAGAKVSQYCSEHLIKSILNAEEASIFSESHNNNNNNSNSLTNSNKQTNNDSTQQQASLSQSSNSSSSNLTQNNNNNNNNTSSNDSQNTKIRNAIVKGFLTLDESIRKLPEFKNGEDKSGSTAVACLISPHNIYLINCGDSRAILVRDQRVHLNTNDHKPINPEERERIQRAGGSVMIQRVNGSLAVSRALGDFEYKNVDGMGPCEQLVSPEPEIFITERSEKDEFLVLACDGIWDVMSNEDINEFIRYKLKLTPNLVQISNEVLDTCLYKGSRDNMSIVLVTFPGAPKVEKDDIEKERSLNDKLETRIKELVSEDPSQDLSQLLNKLSHENFENLPPAGGLFAKQGFIEDIYHKLVPKNNKDDNPSSHDPFGSPS